MLLKQVFSLIIFSTVTKNASAYQSEAELYSPKMISTEIKNDISKRCLLASELRSQIRYPDIPDVHKIHLPDRDPIPLRPTMTQSPGLCSPVLEEARILNLVDDFKYLSDLRQKNLSVSDWNLEIKKAEAATQEKCKKPNNCSKTEERKIFLKNYIERVYYHKGELVYFVDPLTYPAWKITGSRDISEAFDYVESLWHKLIRINPIASEGSLLLSPYPIAIPAGRFEEAYYWDTYFGIEGLIAVKRLELARMQAENLLFNIRRFGFVPNGQRDYYLSRSQVPFSAVIIKRVLEESLSDYRLAGDKKKEEHALLWAKTRALPLLDAEFSDFWMNSATRYDESSGLFHHWDTLNIKRPERHSLDVEENLGKSFRDVRAMFESGYEPTGGFIGRSKKNEITRIGTVLLNAMIYKTLTDIRSIAELVDDQVRFKKYDELAKKKKQVFNALLWNHSAGLYQPYHLDQKKQLSIVAAATFTPMFAQLASKEQAAKIMAASKPLFKKGGIASSLSKSKSHLWEGNVGSAPWQMMTVIGMKNYGYHREALELSQNWTRAVAKVFQKHGSFYDKIDLESFDYPKFYGEKYPVQEGYLWTNASFVWMLTTIEGKKLESISQSEKAESIK